MKLTHLFRDFYSNLRSFLSNDDYVCLMNTSEREYGEIRRKTIYLPLTNMASYKFVTEFSFQQRVASCVENPMKQISLNFTFEFGCEVEFLTFAVHRVAMSRLSSLFHCLLTSLNNVEHIEQLEGRRLTSFPFLPKLSSLSFEDLSKTLVDVVNLSHLMKLSLTDCHQLRDITPLRNIPDLSLKRCQPIQDFSCLGEQRRLEIVECPGLNDVRSFGRVKELIIGDEAERIIDWSSLYGIHSLTIITSKSVFDVSGLGGHHRFSLTISIVFVLEVAGVQVDEGVEGGQLQGMEHLQDISVVHLCRCSNCDLNFLSRAKEVTLVDCSFASDVAVLSKVPKICLQNCDGFKRDLSALQHVKDLSIGGLTRTTLTKFPPREIRNHQKLRLIDVHCASKWDDVHGVEHLMFEKVEFKHFHLMRFNDVQIIEFIECPLLERLKGMEYVPHVIIDFCPELDSLKGLGNNRSVTLKYCCEILSVAPIRFVPIVKILHCPNIRDLDILDNVPRLKIVP